MRNAGTILLLILSLAVPTFAQDETHATVGAGPRLTLELQDVNILDVLKILSKKSGLNIVAGKGIQGQISIFLRDVSVDDALKTILASQQLASVREGDVTKIITEQEYLEKFGRPYEDKRVTRTFHLRYVQADVLASQLSTLKSPHGKILTEPLTNTLIITEIPDVMNDMDVLVQESEIPQETEIIELQYARAEDLEPRLKDYLQGSPGKLEVDKRTNQIIMTDIPSRIDKIKSVVAAFDRQVPQVLIEAKLVEVRLGDGYRRGINWQDIIKELGKFDTLKAALPLAVSPPVGALSITSFALGNQSKNLSVVLDLLERVGKTNLLSSPRVMVMNNEEAKIAVGTKRPFVSQTVVQTLNASSTADNVQFVDIGVSLKVLPHISHDDYVEMKIKPEVSSSNETLELQSVAPGSDTVFTRTSIPIVTTQELETTVRVKSGTTIVVGGLIQDRIEKDTNKIPFIGSVPVVGKAFQSKSHDFEKTELVVFLTPTIIRPYEQPEFTKEEARFFDPEKNMLPFDEFGNYPYKTTYSDPKRYIKTGDVPYWENPNKFKTIQSIPIPADELQEKMDAQVPVQNANQ